MRVSRIVIFLLLNSFFYNSEAQVTAAFSVNYQNPNCAPTSVLFNDLSTGAGLQYEWNFGVNAGVNSTLPSPSTLYLTCGNFVVTLIVTDGTNIDTATQIINIFCSPVASFNASPLSGCIPLNVLFTSTTTLGSAPISTYFWDYGDGNTGNLNPVNHNYTISGCKNVTLIVTDANGCNDDTTMANLICIDDQPSASFTSSANVSCSAPFQIDFTNTSTGTGVLNYQWQFPGGTPAVSIQTNPSVTYNTPGLYDVILIVTNASGCSDTITQSNFAAIASNTADFTMSSASGCVPFTLTVQGLASSPPVLWSWTTTPSAVPPTSNSQNSQFTFNGVGSYQVCLQIEYPGGCLANKCSTIVVANFPNADFTLTGNVYTCNPPQIIDFNNASTGGPGLTYSWQFPGGNPSFWSNGNPPNISYNNCGIYDATLIVTNSAGCSDTFSYDSAAYIDCPAANFVSLPFSGCAPLNTNFLYTGVTGSPTSWQWSFGDPSSGAANISNLQNPSHTYLNVGCYNVRLIVSNALGCADTIIHQNEVCVGNSPSANFSANPPVSCAYHEIAFTNLSTGTDSTTSFQWDFMGSPPFDVMSNSSDPQYLYPDTGWFNVTLVVCNNGCCDTLTIDSMVHILPPIANFFVESTCADPYNITLHGGVSLAADSFMWTVPGGIPSALYDSVITVNYPSNGTYTIQLVVQNFQTGCFDTIIQDIIINNVIADFVADDTTICSPDQVCFTNLSQNASSYSWAIFNNIGSQVWASNAIDPCRNFNSPGKFSVQLVATDVNGCTDTLYKNLYIYAYGLNLNFTGTPLSGCIPLTVAFSGAATSTVSTVVSFYWNFGDTASGNLDTSSIQNPNHIYNDVGSYDVTLITIDNHGCYDTLQIPQYVNPYQPNVSFIAIDSTVCLGESTCFFNSSFGGSLSYQWDFGDNSTSFQMNPCHTYLSVGDYTVTLIGSDTAGCADTMIRTLYIHVTNPVAAFTADSTYSSCPPLPVNFTSTSTGVDASTTYEWLFGDGSNSNVQNPFHIYNLPGYYDVTLIIHNQFGCDDTLQIDSMISITGPTATVTVSPTSGCNPLNVCFIANSNTTTSYTWDFGDGNVVPFANDSICYTYTIPGTFFPSLLLDNGAGCVYSFPIDSIVAGGPNVNWNPDIPYLCNSGTVIFNDSTFGISPITSWFWTFGDSLSGLNDSSILQNPSHFYDTIGTYIVTLFVNTQNGCTGILSDTVNVYPPPVIGITADDLTPCINTAVNFNYNSTQAITSWHWTFGDLLSGINDTSFVSTPSHIFSSAGIYTVTLIASGIGSCGDTTTIDVTVLALPNPNISANTSVCPNASTQLSAGNGVTYSWSPNTYLNNPAIANPVSSPVNNITYTVTVTDVNGCVNVDSVSVSVYPSPVITASAMVNDTTCSGVAVQLSASGGIQYTWQPAAVLNNNVLQNPTATIFISTTFTVNGTDSNGCTADASVSITVLPNPVIVGGSNATICFGDTTQLTGNGGMNYSWTPTAGLSNPTISNPIANPTITTTYIVSATDSNNCIGTANVIVNVNALPLANAGVDDTICIGFSGQLNASGGLVYVWNPPAYLDNNLISNPLCTPIADITYTVSVTDINNCYALDSVIVKVLPAPIFNARGDTTVCESQTIQMFASGGTSYSWLPSAGLSNPFDSSTFVTTNNTSIYSVIITDDVCMASDTLQVTITVVPLPTAFAGSDASIIAGDSYSINADASDVFSWSPPAGLSCTECEDPIASPLENSTYTLSAVNAFGCKAEDSMVIIVNCSDNILYIPNVFSPNGNGKNDVFKVRSSGIRELNFLRVYDRWGELVFESSDQNIGWDGTFKGVQLPPAVYVFYLKAVCGDGFIIERQGNVTLIR